jgi:hypothetical protein
VQCEWADQAEGEVTAEKTVRKPSGRAGRVDVYVVADGKLVAVAEIKASDWDRMTLRALRRNARRQIRQIWRYIDSQLAAGKDVSPGVIFPHRPRDPDRMKLIEDLFEGEGIPVVRDDETKKARKARS